MVCFSVGLVLIEHNVLVRVAARSVQPHIMKQIMIANRRAVGMVRLALLPSELVHAEIHKAVVRKNVEAYLAAGEGVDLPLGHVGCLPSCADDSIYHFAS